MRETLLAHVRCHDETRVESHAAVASALYVASWSLSTGLDARDGGAKACLYAVRSRNAY